MSDLWKGLAAVYAKELAKAYRMGAHRITDGVLMSGPFAGARVRSVPRPNDQLRQGVDGVQAGISGVPPIIPDKHLRSFDELFWDRLFGLKEVEGRKQGSPEAL